MSPAIYESTIPVRLHFFLDVIGFLYTATIGMRKKAVVAQHWLSFNRIIAKPPILFLAYLQTAFIVTVHHSLVSNFLGICVPSAPVAQRAWVLAVGFS